MRIALALMFSLVPALGHAACTDAVGLLTRVESAVDAFGAADVDAFLELTDAVRADLPCTQGRVPRNLAAALHRVEGLRAFVDRDPIRSAQAFAAARALEPAFAFPAGFVPDGHPVLHLYGALALEGDLGTAPPVPPGGVLYLDGRASGERFATRPSVVQWIDDEGAVRTTGYAWPGAAALGEAIGGAP